ncbi:MAG: hydrogenase maturation protease [Candidatus Fermentithermobacillus carboniphilus]|uniref:Hydrogenase maturation protease n=1 Tax=Candidatus Fermentithermobacillus carboniphilus TaxID=3085328 RepID=A0AAT9L9I2_9FIRM|nr:MAG: hydrogenase maturation protease [Candidatus Fermentithermobacillus carboniphilus]
MTQDLCQYSNEADWKRELAAFLSGARRVSVLGVGNEIRGDDGAGTRVARLLGRLGTSASGIPCLYVPGGSAPENYAGLIVKFSPTHAIIVDAFDSGKAPGTISPVSDVYVQGVSLSSHRFPLGMLKDFFHREGIENCFILGIQPLSIELGERMSLPVKKACREVARTISDLLQKTSGEGQHPGFGRKSSAFGRH